MQATYAEMALNTSSHTAPTDPSCNILKIPY